MTLQKAVVGFIWLVFASNSACWEKLSAEKQGQSCLTEKSVQNWKQIEFCKKKLFWSATLGPKIAYAVVLLKKHKFVDTGLAVFKEMGFKRSLLTPLLLRM